MTEDEAKTKWCPFVRHAESGGGSWNRATWSDGDIINLNHHDGRYACNCIGSACMAWRWNTDRWILEFDATGPYKKRPAHDSVDGCCGLAGKP